jgi:hypothetical protein
MSTVQRRTWGAVAALLVLLTASLYVGWRLRVIGGEGWAGVSYFPVVQVKGKIQRSPFMTPGAVYILYPGAPAELAGIRRGDQIVSANGVPIESENGIAALSRRLHHGDVITYRVNRGGVLHDYAVRLGSPLDVPFFIGLFSVTCFVALIFLGIGLFVYWRRPRDVRAVVFFAMTLCAAATFANGSIVQVESVSSRGLSVPQATFNQLGPTLLVVAMSSFFAPLLLHLSLVFPKRRPVLARGRTLWQWIYGYPLLLVGTAGIFGAVMSGVLYFDRKGNEAVIKNVLAGCGIALASAAVIALVRLGLSIRVRGWREGVLQRPFASILTTTALCVGLTIGATALQQKAKMPMALAFASMVGAFALIASFAAYPIATFIALYRSYRDSNLEERQQVKWPLWGTMISVGSRILLSIVGTAVGMVITFRSDISVPSAVVVLPEAIGKLIYLLIPISFAVAILKYRLMNIDVIIRKTVLYSILSAIVLVVYVGLVAGVGSLVIHFTAVKSQTMVIASTIFVGLIAIPLRNKLQRMVDRNLFREQRNFALALRNISGAIGGGDLHIFLQKAAEQVQQAVQSRFVLAALRSETHYGAAAKVGIGDEILRTLQIPFAEFPEGAPETAPALRRLGTELVIPFRSHGASLGFLALGPRLSDQQYAPDDVQFLTEAAQQIALGIENVRLRSEETDFAQARAMQQILLPTHFPKVDGFGISGMWQPARSVGGDYFDTIALGDGKVAVCIADVAGKGMPAALMMANLQAAVKATAAPGLDPAQLCEKVKRVVTGNLAGGTFITFFYGVLDASSKTFRYSNAGHNPPIVVRADGGVERLSVGGPAICRLFRNEPHTAGSVELRPGDRLVLFTDGASEARRGEEEFGEERVVATVVANRHLGAQPLQSALAGAIAAFCGGNLDDDLTLVVVAAE